MTKTPSGVIARKWGRRHQTWDPPPAPLPPVPLLPAFDWRGHRVGYTRSACRICGMGAFCADEDGVPCHKVCAERLLVTQVGHAAAVEWAGRQIQGRVAKKRGRKV